MKKKIAVLIIDAQNDFCSPKGSLFVPGAEEDNERLSGWILDNKDEIGHISCTLDSHQLIDIAHPGFWVDKDGNNPQPFSVITAEQVRSGDFRPVMGTINKAIDYLQSLEDEGEYAHVIWPEHCIIGTWGNQLDQKVNDACLAWARNGHHLSYVSKGSHPYSEHFGAFKAQVPQENYPSTQFNFGLQQTLEKFDTVYLAGQAKSHCVANTLKQVVKEVPNLAKKFVILTDTMSDVPGGPAGPGTTPTFGELAQPIYDEAKALGVKFSTTVAEGVNAKSGAATATA